MWTCSSQFFLAVLAVVQTPWFKRYARDFIVAQSHSVLNGDLQIGRIGGNFITGLILEGI